MAHVFRIISVALVLALPAVVHACPVPLNQVYRITSPSGTEDDFGLSVSLFEGVAFVGAPWDSNAQGAAYLFPIDDPGAIQTIVANDRATSTLFGDAVALTEDFVFVGAWDAQRDGISTGAVYRYERPGFTNEQILTPTDASRQDRVGDAIAARGDLLAIGAPRYRVGGDEIGSVYAYNATTGQLMSVARIPELGDGRLGSQVAIGASRIVALAPDVFSPRGRGRAFVIDPETGNIAAELLADDQPDSATEIVSIAATDRYIVLGARTEPAGSPTRAEAYVFDAATLALVDVLTPGGCVLESSPRAVAVSGDRVAMSASAAFEGGPSRTAVFVFDLLTGDEFPPMFPAMALTSFAAALDMEGDTIITGRGDGTTFGAIHVFDLEGVRPSCNAADVAPPYSQLDLADIGRWVTAFMDEDLLADANNNGVFDLFDVSAFVTAFTAGCP